MEIVYLPAPISIGRLCVQYLATIMTLIAALLCALSGSIAT